MQGIIVGGGIGGLCAAIALNRIGIASTVLERAASLSEIGAGLSLWTNAAFALNRLGLEEQIEALGYATRSSEITSWKGQKLRSIGYRHPTDDSQPDARIVHRYELQSLLYSQLPDQQVKFGKQVEGFEASADEVCVTTSSGEELVADFLVGADGIHSTVRKLSSHANDTLRYAGYVGWRGISALQSSEYPKGSSLLSVGPGAYVGLFPMDEQRSYWFASKRTPLGTRIPREDWKEAALAAFSRWHSPIPEMIEQTASEHVLLNDVYDRLPLSRWGKGRMTLLGDAAHPTTPNLGQGACQAIEDALVLARCLQNHSGVEYALKSYEAERKPRTARVTKASWRMGQILQLENPFLCGLRDSIIQLAPQAWLRPAPWLVNHRVSDI